MATTPLKYLHQYFTTTLNVGGGLTNSQTTGIVIQAVSGLDITKPGVACLTYADPINTSTAEWITYTSINGSNELQGVVRGAEGFGAKTHSNGAVVAFPLSESHINDLNAMFDSTGLDIAQIATPANPSSGRNKIYPKSDGKFYKLSSAGVEETIEKLSDEWIDVADGATMTFDLANVANKLKFLCGALAGNRTFAISNATEGKVFMIRIPQDGTGSRTVTWFPAGTDTVTMTIANPGVVTTTIDMKTGTPVVFTTTGALPTGITASTVYYWIRTAATTGNVATSKANALAGTTITTSGTQSGVHTMLPQILWAGGTAPTLTTSKWAYDDIGFIVHGTGQITGIAIAQDM